MKIKLDIKSNAVDSFNEALAKFESAQNGDVKAYKFTILHLSHAIELVLKMYLQTLDENLVFSKCYQKVKQRSSAKKSIYWLLSTSLKLKSLILRALSKVMIIHLLLL